MGVRGLETFLEKYSDACYEVSIGELVSEYRERTSDKNPILVVDGMSILKYLYSGLSWLNGGQFKEYIQNVKRFVQKFEDLGLSLTFFFDGPTLNRKRPLWIKRRLNDMESVHAILDKLSTSGSVESIAKTNFISLPSNLSWLTVNVFKDCGCEVYLTFRECDEEIAEYAEKYRCFGIIGQDTDFVIFEGGQYYLSMKNLDMDKMTTLNYDRMKLAYSLSLTPGHLPLLATLIGNDVIPQEELTSFHQVLCRTRHRQIPFNRRFEEVSRFIRFKNLNPQNLTGCLKWLAGQVFKDTSKSDLLLESINSYFPSLTNAAEICISDRKWETVFKKAQELHRKYFFPPHIYGIISDKGYQSSTCLEDYRKYDLPKAGEFQLPLRERIYGILLKEKPCDEGGHIVKEWVMAGPESLKSAKHVRAVMPTVQHPGLVALWESKDEGMEEIRWNLVLEALESGVHKLPSFPKNLVVAILSMAYLHDRKVNLLEWEMDVLIAVTVIVGDYTTESLKSLPSDPIDVRALRIYTLFGRLCSTVILLIAACGYPLPILHTMPDSYTDGKLFHVKYNQAKKNCNHLDLCNKMISNFETFQQIKSYIFNRALHS